MKKRMKKVATLCLAGVTAMSTVGVTGSAVFAKGDTNYDVDNMDFENVELRVAFRFNNGSDLIQTDRLNGITKHLMSSIKRTKERSM